MLNPNVEVLSVREFAPAVRDRLGGSDDDFVISDRTTRIGSQRIGRDAALFLRRFRSPSRIVDAVFEHSTELQIDPQVLLADVYPLVRALRLQAILIPPGARAEASGKRLSKGDRLGDLVIVEVARQIGDTDVLKGRSARGAVVAIKRVTTGASQDVRDNLRREAAVLGHARVVGCRAVPLLMGQDLDRDDPYIWMEWLRGQTLFDLLRQEPPAVLRRAKIVRSLVACYADLHEYGILHGDVHPNNVMVATDGSARLIDFGGAQLLGHELEGGRIGLVQFYEPEVARAVLAGQEPPMPTPAGEQYGVAALAFAALTGNFPIALSLVTETALRQIATSHPRSFEEFGLTWPRVEAVLAQALAKHPGERFPTFSAFKSALVDGLAARSMLSVSSRPQQPPARPFPQGELKRAARQVVAEYGLRSDAIKGFDRGPKASVYGGGAGVALALLRIACLSNDGASLAAADIWIRRAKGVSADSLAFSDGSIGQSVETGKLSLFQSITGVHVVEALVRHASGDTDESRAAIAAFASAISSANKSLATFPMDGTNGAASLLFGAALLLPIAPDAQAVRLRSLGRRLAEIVEGQLNERQPENVHVGFAHGRAGAVYAVLRWAEASGNTSPPTVRRSLDKLAALAVRRGGSLTWPIGIGDDAQKGWTGWCHGSAGHLLLWTLAARVLGEDALVENALAAGQDIWRRQGSSGPSLCCGGAGEALALYELARATGSDSWVDRGRSLAAGAAVAAQTIGSSQGLFRSALGVGLVAAESADPQEAAWPVLQSPLGVT